MRWWPAPASLMLLASVGVAGVAARRSAPTRRSLQPGYPGGLAAGRGRHPGGDGGHRPAAGSRSGRCWKSAGSSCCWSTPATTRIPPGRKTDVGDAAWLCELLRVRAAARQLRAPAADPPAAGSDPRPQAAPSRPMAPSASGSKRPWRTPAASRVSVATDVLGVSGRAMLEALVAGERDRKVLAELAKGKLPKEAPPTAPGAARPLRRPPWAAGRAGP
jgi:hypothetical protein